MGKTTLTYYGNKSLMERNEMMCFGLFSARDFLFSFVQLTSLTFPDVFLDLSNGQGL